MLRSLSSGGGGGVIFCANALTWMLTWTPHKAVVFVALSLLSVFAYCLQVLHPSCCGTSLFFLSLSPSSLLGSSASFAFLVVVPANVSHVDSVSEGERKSALSLILVCVPAAMIVPLLTSLIIIGSSTRHPNNMLPLSPSEPFIRQSRRLISYSLSVNLCVPRAHTRSLAQTRKQLFPAYPSAAEVCIFYTHSTLF